MLCLVLLAGYGGSLCGGAGAGPNPGAGFYGAPNINTGLLTLDAVKFGSPRDDGSPLSSGCAHRLVAAGDLACRLDHLLRLGRSECLDRHRAFNDRRQVVSGSTLAV